MCHRPVCFPVDNGHAAYGINWVLFSNTTLQYIHDRSLGIQCNSSPPAHAVAAHVSVVTIRVAPPLVGIGASWVSGAKSTIRRSLGIGWLVGLASLALIRPLIEPRALSTVRGVRTPISHYAMASSHPRPCGEHRQGQSGSEKSDCQNNHPFLHDLSSNLSLCLLFHRASGMPQCGISDKSN
jgi:hypothetical protein